MTFYLFSVIILFMSYDKKIENWKEKVIEASKTSTSATAAAALLGIKYTTYKKYATEYGCFETNQSGKGVSRNRDNTSLPLWDILEGKHPQYQSNKLRIRLLKEEVFEHKCVSCNNTTWLDEPIPLELEHKDGNSTNHCINNLELLCPNCHAKTSTYRGKNKRILP